MFYLTFLVFSALVAKHGLAFTGGRSADQLPLLPDEQGHLQMTKIIRSQVRSQVDAEKSERKFETHLGGSLIAVEANGHFQATEAVRGGTSTTTLSAMHLMSSTVGAGLASPPENEVRFTTHEPERRASTTLASLEEIANGEPAITADEVITADQVGNKLAAFQVSMSGPIAGTHLDFNGVYLPSTTQNTAEGACTSLVWIMHSTKCITPSTDCDNYYLLYNFKGTWMLVHRGDKPSYNGADHDFSCVPETAEWAAIDQLQGSIPIVSRKTAAFYTVATEGSTQSSTNDTSSNGAAATSQYAICFPYCYVVSGATFDGFNGVYYQTPEVVVNQRCQRFWAKDGPDKTEYTLMYQSPTYVGDLKGEWFFQSLIEGEQQRPYIGQDDDSCSPESAKVSWQVTVDPMATSLVLSNIIDEDLKVVRYTATMLAADAAAAADKAAADAAAAKEAEDAAAVAGTTTTLLQSSNPTITTRTDVEADAHPGVSRWWLRLYLPLSLWLGMEGLKLSA